MCKKAAATIIFSFEGKRLKGTKRKKFWGAEELAAS